MQPKTLVQRALLGCLISLSVLSGTTPCQAQDMAAATPVNTDLVINGPYYKKIVQMKDVIADILPPPAYIIESHLTVLQMIDEAEKAMQDGQIDAKEMRGIDDLIEYGRRLEEGDSSKGEAAGYLERQAVWAKGLPEASEEDRQLKDWMCTRSFTPAKKFFEIRNTKFNPLIKAGKVSEAKQVARAELRPLYEEHRKAIDEVVTRSRTINSRIESEVAGAASADAVIGGTLYKKVIDMKDLVADILPPPAYIIESYLVVLEMVDMAEVAMADGKMEPKETAALDQRAEYGRQLKSGVSSKGELPGYEERQAFWRVDLAQTTDKEIKIKELMTKLSYEPAMKFYELRDSQLMPQIKAGNVEAAKKVVRDVLQPAYSSHRIYIDRLVLAADRQFKSVESEVQTLLAAN